jgi:hypothetical protein
MPDARGTKTMSNEFVCEHLFKVSISLSKFEAMVTKACRGPFAIELIAHDPGVVPQLRLFNVEFSTPEDRDRMRIAMRFVEKEQAAIGNATPRTAPTAIPGRLASA